MAGLSNWLVQHYEKHTAAGDHCSHSAWGPSRQQVDRMPGGLAMLAKLVCAVAVVSTVCVPPWGAKARAEILITTAAIARGELTIVGRIRRAREPGVQIKINPNKTVQVEGTPTGGFRWIGTEFPSTCVVEISSGADKREVLIQNCGVAGPARPDGSGRTKGRFRRGRQAIASVYSDQG